MKKKDIIPLWILLIIISAIILIIGFGENSSTLRIAGIIILLIANLYNIIKRLKG